MNTVDKKVTVSVIGLGKIGKAIATNLAKGNHAVIVAARELKEAQTFAVSLGSNATGQEIATAIENADVVIPAISFNALKEFLSNYANELAGKVIVDVSNPIAPDGNGGFKKIIDQDQSAGQILADLKPAKAALVKAFSSLGADSLANAAFSEPERKVLFYASDSTNSNSKIEELITDSGFAPFHVGGLNQSLRIEVFGDLHEFGPLGKTVILKDAKDAAYQHSL